MAEKEGAPLLGKIEKHKHRNTSSNNRNETLRNAYGGVHGKDETLMYFPSNQFSSRYGDKYYTIEFLSFKINAEDACLGRLLGFRYVAYQIKVLNGKNAWTIEKRFRDFISFGSKCRIKYPKIAPRIPADPPKTCFLKKKTDDPAFLKQRRDALIAYIERILIIVSELRVNSEIIEEFLGFTL